MKRIVWLIAFLLLFPTSTKAFQCTSSTYEALQEFANNVTVSVEEEENNGNLYFSATFSGVYSKLRFEVQNMVGAYFGGVDERLGEFTVNGLKPGKSYVFEVYGADSCFSYKFRTITLDLPEYNKFYNETICQNAREYALCQKWSNVNLSYDEFSKKVNEYIETRDDGLKGITPEEPSESLFWYLYENYYWVALSSLIIFLGILIWLWIRENKKNKL